MAVSKVVKSNGDVIMDISQDNVNPNNLLQGGTAHGSDGEAVQGAVIVAPTDVTEVSDTTPYIYKLSEHDAVYDELVGGSVAWNQLIQNGNFESTSRWNGRYSTISVSNNVCTVTPSSDGTFRGLIGVDTITDTTIAGHKYLISVDVLSPVVTNIALSMEGIEAQFAYAPANVWRRCACIWTNTSITRRRIYALLVDNVTTSQTIMYKNVYTIDLTQMFGPTIADYVYSLEQSTAGSGIAWLKSYGFFIKDYYAYNEGSLVSANVSGKKVTGKNQCNNVRAGVYYTSNGNYDAALTGYSCTEKIKILPNTQYTVSVIKNSGSIGTDNGALFYDANGAYLGRYTGGYSHTDTYPFTFTTPSNATYCGIDINIQKSSIDGVQLELGSTATDYEPYTSITYPIQSTDLRGLYKLDANNKLYTDGDIYSADGQITRKYGIVDLGTLDWYKNTTYNVFYTSSTAVPKKTGRTNILCQKYTIVDKSYITLSNKEITGESQTQGINIKDDDYSTSYDFKTAMSGVYLIYELATPTTAPAPPFTTPQMVYRQGTEEFIDTRDVPMPVGGNRKYVDIPDWMINEYFDDVRAKTSTISEVKKELNDFEERLEAFIIKSSFTNPSTITNTSDFTDELFDKYWGSNTDLYPRFAHLFLSGNTRVFLKAIISSVLSGSSIRMIKATFIYGQTMYDFTWIKGQTPIISEYTIQVISPT